MSRKDYRALAAGLRKIVDAARTVEGQEVARAAVLVVTTTFANDPGFDWMAFMGACGYKERHHVT